MAFAADEQGTIVSEAPRVAIFAPSPILTITVEPFPSADDEIHLAALLRYALRQQHVRSRICRPRVRSIK